MMSRTPPKRASCAASCSESGSGSITTLPAGRLQKTLWKSTLRSSLKSDQLQRLGSCSCFMPSPGDALRAAGASGAGRQVLGGEIPVDQVLEERRDVVGAPVLEVEIVGVLPDIH